MNDVSVGNGKYARIQEGKGVFATRDFDTGEVVLLYTLTKLSPTDFSILPEVKRQYVHSFWGAMYLFSEPARYVNHAPEPNTTSDVERQVQIAIRPIQKGEMITINATKEVQYELETYVRAYEGSEVVRSFVWIRGGYRNAVVEYIVGRRRKKQLTMKRIDGNWCIVDEQVM